MTRLFSWRGCFYIVKQIRNSHLGILICLSVLFAACSTNSASWMEDSYQYIDNKKITEITLPGTYIANAYDIDLDNPKCIGEVLPQSYSNNAQIEENLSRLSANDSLNLFADQLSTQNFDIAAQLKSGVRYLDLRVCQQDGEFYTANLYLTEKLDNITEQINQFLASHPQEIVLVDFDNNLRNESGYMDNQSIAAFHTYLYKTFGNLIIPKDKMLNTIGELKQQHYQLIILSANSELAAYPDIWNKDQIAITIDAQSSTIKRLSVLESLLGSNAMVFPDKLNIVPLYSDIDMSILDDNTDDNEVEQSILLNYLEQNLENRPGVIVSDKNFLKKVEYLIIQQDANLTLIESNPVVESNVLFAESSPLIESYG